MRNRILPVALVAALLGGTVGAFVGRTSKTTEPTDRSALASALTSDDAVVRDDKSLTPEQTLSTGDAALTASGDVDPQYRTGFIDGFRAAAANDRIASNRVVNTTRVVERPVYRNRTVRSRASNYSNSRQVYYDYDNQPRKRSFWQKHRDKLTVAAGTGGGALIGGLIGGKKGALIGALAGGGGSALYTYKLRNRNRRY
jgi:hypothetical protein